MQFVSTIGAASGKLGGLVASQGRHGAQMRIARPARQPRSVSQQNARAQTGSLAAAWREISQAQRLSWDTLAANVLRTDALGQRFQLSGYALFVSCNRNLETIGVNHLLTAAPNVPSFPALATFSATPLYTSPTPPYFLSGFTLTYGPAVTIPWAGVIRASAALSPGRGNVRPSDLRIIAALNPVPSESTAVYTDWVAIWGVPLPSGQITFALNLVDPISGLVGAAVRAVTSYSYTPTPAPTPGTVTVEVEGVTIAEIPDTYIQVEGITVAN
jgi:hypothetical protein